MSDLENNRTINLGSCSQVQNMKLVRKEAEQYMAQLDQQRPQNKAQAWVHGQKLRSKRAFTNWAAKAVRAEDWTYYSPRGSVGVGGEHASHQGYCINIPPGMCTGIHMRAQSDRLHGDLCNIMNKLGKVELWSQQTWRRLNGRALVNNSTGFKTDK